MTENGVLHSAVAEIFKRGGGVLFYIKKNRSLRRREFQINKIENLPKIGGGARLVRPPPPPTLPLNPPLHWLYQSTGKEFMHGDLSWRANVNGDGYMD